MFDNLFMLLEENGSTNILTVKFAYQGRNVMGTFRCRQTKPEINILFAVCRVLNSFDVFNNLFMLSKENGSTNTVTVKFAYQGRKVMGTFRCRQTKPEINILFAVCRALY